MDLDDLIITWCCRIDEGLHRVLDGKRLRTSGPHPTLADSEVLTMEVVGEYLGLEHDTAIFAYFRRHSSHCFPALTHLHRTTLVRQAANLPVMKDRLWQWIRDQIPYDSQLAIVDSLAWPVGPFTRAPRCRRFRGEAASGHDHGHASALLGFPVACSSVLARGALSDRVDAGQWARVGRSARSECRYERFAHR